MQFKSLQDKEREAADRYSQSLIDEDKKKQKKSCPHRWEIQFVNNNKAIKTCKMCGEKKHKQWTNEQAQYGKKHIGDFAQPGTKFFKKQKG